MLDLNDFAKAVHDNATGHGWWDDERDFAEICALIHSEWSEALEEARAKRDMVWNGENGKPEGIAVELIDGVIRILDWIGKVGTNIFPATLKNLISDQMREKMRNEPLSHLVARLHSYTSCAYAEEEDSDRGDYLISAMVAVINWLDAHGVNAEQVLIAKHEYNKTRPYKHNKAF